MTDRLGFVARLRGKIVALAADQNGMVLPYVTAIMAILLGLAMLGTDLSRYVDLHSQLQKAADAFALAGAAELDGQAGARARATAAINGLMASYNSSVWGPSAAAVTASSITFFQTLPANNQALGGTVAGSDATANSVHVVVSPVAMTSFIPATIFGGANTVQTQAEAAAGAAGSSSCVWTPVFICNPLEGTGQPLSSIVGHELQLKLGPGSGGFSPGNYGYLAPNDLQGNPQQGASNLWPSLAATNPRTCHRQDTVTTQTGQVTSADAYLNTRFDLYNPPATGRRNDPDYPPAQNVRKGRLGSACNANPNAQHLSYLNDYGNPYKPPTAAIDPTCPNPGTGSPPYDACYRFNDCQQPPVAVPPNPQLRSLAACALPRDDSYNGSGVGSGQWRLGDYWTVNHPDHTISGGAVTPAPALRGQSVATPWGSPTVGTPTNLATRYQVYQYEIGNNNGDRSAGLIGPPAVLGESGPPQCSSQPLPPNVDGRLITVAIANCTANPIGGGNSSFTPAGYWQFFLTRPICQTCQDPNDDNVLYGELIGQITPGGQGAGAPANVAPITRNVQLVR